MNGKEPMKHDFDGIKELDNFLPRWWLGLFYLTIAFGAVYFLYYELFDGPTLHEELQVELNQIQASQLKNKPGPSGPSEDELNAVVKAPDQLASGKAVFSTRCIACHGANGEGGIGPNLTDDYWINGKGTLTDILKVVREGVGAKGMPPWGPLLSEAELRSVTAFVKTLRGTNPANAKAPQGLLIKN